MVVMALGRRRMVAARRLLAAVVWIAGIAVSASAADPPAIVNGRLMDGWEFDRELAVRISAGSYHRQISDERRSELRCESLRVLVLKELKLQWARGKNIAVDPAVEEAAWFEMRERFSSENQYRSALETKGMSEAALRRAFHRDAVTEAVDEFTISAVTPPGETEIEVYFLIRSDEYMTPEARRVVHVLVHVPPSAGRDEWRAAEERATELSRRAADGEGSLMELASAELERLPPRFRDQVGDIGFVHRGSLAPVVDAVVFSTEIGSVTEPVSTIYGYHVIHVTDRRPPKPMELAQVREAVEERVVREKRQRRLDAFEGELLAGAAIEIGLSECAGIF